MLSLRRLAAALAVALPLLVVSACFATPSDPDNDALEAAVTTFMDTLGRGEYEAAHGLICVAERADTDPEKLRAEFEPHPRPWKQSIWATSRSGDSGDANLALTPQGQAKVEYTFGLVRAEGGSWQLCDVARGSFAVDP